MESWDLSRATIGATLIRQVNISLLDPLATSNSKNRKSCDSLTPKDEEGLQKSEVEGNNYKGRKAFASLIEESLQISDQKRYKIGFVTLP